MKLRAIFILRYHSCECELQGLIVYARCCTSIFDGLVSRVLWRAVGGGGGCQGRARPTPGGLVAEAEGGREVQSTLSLSLDQGGGRGASSQMAFTSK